MVETLKILGQVIPGAAANTTLYEAGEKTQAVVSSLSICETGGAAATVRVFVVPKNGTASTSNALYYGLPMVANDTFVATIGMTLPAESTIVVYSSTANVCFQAFGSEITPK